MKDDEFFRPDPSKNIPERIAYLINGYNRKNLSESEHDELDEWVTMNLKNQQIFEELTDPVFLQKWVDWKDRLEPDAALERIRMKTQEESGITARSKSRILPYMVTAAALLTFLLYGARWFIRNKTSQDVPMAAVQQDLLPGGEHAVLITGDGKMIMLDTAQSGKLHAGSTTEILKDSTGLRYLGSGQAGRKPKENELKTPAGGEFQVTLNDGTRVWLNASSSLKYPEFFSDSVRRVELSGEGYFEVAKDAAHPFIVVSGRNEVRVLGTHFNVNAYSDNLVTTVTLAEGSVRINGKMLLKPGEEGLMSDNGKMWMQPADMESALAWKNGMFVFKMMPLDEVMQQVAHWYDAKIIYQAKNTEHFKASISRDVPVSKLLQILEATGQVHFKIEGRTITVLN